MFSLAGAKLDSSTEVQAMVIGLLPTATAGGNRPVKDFLLKLPKYESAAVLAAMAEVQELGLGAARHLRDEIWEVRASGENRIIRILFAPEGRYGQVLLAIEGFIKKTRQTPDAEIELALKRLKDWRSRGQQRD